jgi:murein DD-endopeptidase MepM/ murein hydrolase activator NlpD
MTQQVIPIYYGAIDFTKFDVVIVPRNDWSQAYIANDFVEKIQYRYSIEKPAAEMDIELTNLPPLANEHLVQEGDAVVLFGEKFDAVNGRIMGELRRTTIINLSRKSGEEKTLSLFTADPMFYAQHNDIMAIIPEATALERIEKICVTYGIPFDEGNSVDPGVKLPKRIIRKISIYELMLDAILDSNVLSGSKYVLRFHEGFLRIEQRTLPTTIWVLEEGSNIYELVKSSNISEMRNNIVVVGRSHTIDNPPDLAPDQEDGSLGQVSGHAFDVNAIFQYGLLSDVIYDPNITDDGKAQEYADETLRVKDLIHETITVKGNNINGLDWGEPVFIYESSTQTSGIYFIVSGTHTIDKDGATMEVILSKEDRYTVLENSFERRSQYQKDLLDSIINDINGAPGSSGGKRMTPRPDGPPNTPIQGPPENNPAAPQPQPGDVTEPSKGSGVGPAQNSPQQSSSQKFLHRPTPYAKNQNYGENAGNPGPYGYGPAGHPGIDFAAPSGSDVRAAADGVVVEIHNDAGPLHLGTYVRIRHATGYDTVYGHLIPGSAKQAVGDTVKSGTVIANSDNTGNSTGPHLHFEVRNSRTGATVNPAEFMLDVL